jgi:hypothetical protein
MLGYFRYMQAMKTMMYRSKYIVYFEHFTVLMKNNYTMKMRSTDFLSVC